MGQKILIILAAVLVGFIVLFLLLSNVDCGPPAANNPLSQLHITVRPTNDKNPDWALLKKAFEIRSAGLAEMRIFDVQGDVAVAEFSGAEDPNLLASMLLSTGKIFIKTSADRQIATGDEIDGAMPIGFNDAEGSFGIQVALKEVSATRLSDFSKKSLDEASKKLQLVIDKASVARASIEKDFKTPMLDFKLPKGTSKLEAALVAKILLVELPFDIGANVYKSFFTAPQSKEKAPVMFTDILFEISNRK